MATVVVEVQTSPNEEVDLPVYLTKPTEETTREPRLSLERLPWELEDVRVNSNLSMQDANHGSRSHLELSQQELRDIPVYINPPKQDPASEPRSRLNLILCIVLAINTFLQFIALVTPGWNSYTSYYLSTYESVYYYIGCVDTTPLQNVSTITCKTISYIDGFSDAYRVMVDSGKPALGNYIIMLTTSINKK